MRTKKNSALIYSLVSLLLFAYCASAAQVKSEIPLPDQNLANSKAPLGERRVIFFNTSGGLTHGLDKTAAVRINIGEKAAGVIDSAEYLILHLKPGVYTVNITHWDVFTFNSSHTLEIGGSDVFVETGATITSNKFEAKNQPPEGFASKFRPMRPFP